MLEELLSVLSLCWPLMKLVSNPQIPLGVLEPSELELSTTNPPLVSQQPAHRQESHSHSAAERPRSLSIHSKKEKFNIRYGFLRGQKEEIKSCKPPTSPYSATELFKFEHHGEEQGTRSQVNTMVCVVMAIRGVRNQKELEIQSGRTWISIRRLTWVP